MIGMLRYVVDVDVGGFEQCWCLCIYGDVDGDVDIDMRGGMASNGVYICGLRKRSSPTCISIFFQLNLSLVNYHWYIKLPRFQQILPAASPQVLKPIKWTKPPTPLEFMPVSLELVRIQLQFLDTLKSREPR